MTQMKRISQETFDAQIIVGFPCEGQPHCLLQTVWGDDDSPRSTLHTNQGISLERVASHLFEKGIRNH